MVEGQDCASEGGHEDVDRLVGEPLGLARLRSVEDRHLLSLLDQPVVDAADQEDRPADRLEGDPPIFLEVRQPWLLLVLVRGGEVVPG